MSLLGELAKIFLKSGVAVAGVHVGNGAVQKWKDKREEKENKKKEELAMKNLGKMQIPEDAEEV